MSVPVTDYLARCTVQDGHLLWGGAVTDGVPVVGIFGVGTRSLRRLVYEHYSDSSIQDLGSRYIVKTRCGHSRCLAEQCLALVDRSTGLETKPPMHFLPALPVRSVFELATTL